MLENRSGNFAAAQRYGEEGLEAAQACGATDLVAFMHSNLANTAVWAGDLDSAERRLRESLRLCEKLGYAHASISSLLGEVLIGKGDLAEGTAIIEGAREALAPQDDATNTQRVHYPVLLALAYLAGGRTDEARTLAEGVRGELQAFQRYYIHPQVYLWSAAQLLRMLGYENDAHAFAQAARRRRLEILETIEDAVTRETFKRFIFNRLIEEDAQVDNPLHAWFLPYEAKAGAGAPVQ
jgi:ATP/maltotriose-dependent transcriptional regulator MalT